MAQKELWTDFKAMLKDVKTGTSKVEQNDLPDQDLFGYKSVNDDSVWHIKTSDINVSLENNINIDAPSLLKIISTDSGKQTLLAELNKGKE